jgi:hypothetical protein
MYLNSIGLTRVRLMGIAFLSTIALGAAVCQSRAEAFSPGWTNVASEGSGGAFFYNSDSGLGVTGMFQPDGSFSQFNSFHISPGWSDIVGAGQTAPDNYLLFYNRTTGEGATGRVDSDGNFAACGSVDGGPGWTSVIGYPNGLVVFYNSSTGETKTGMIQDCSFTWTQDFHLSPGWTSLAATGDSRVVFYRSDDGEVATGTFSSDGVFNGQQGGTIARSVGRYRLVSRMMGEGWCVERW